MTVCRNQIFSVEFWEFFHSSAIGCSKIDGTRLLFFITTNKTHQNSQN